MKRAFFVLLLSVSSITAQAANLAVGVMITQDQISEDSKNYVSKSTFTENPSQTHQSFSASAQSARISLRLPLQNTTEFYNFVGLAAELLNTSQVTRETYSTKTTLDIQHEVVYIEYGFMRAISGSIGFEGIVSYGMLLSASGKYKDQFTDSNIPAEDTKISGSKGRYLTIYPGLSWQPTPSVIIGLHYGYRWGADSVTRQGDISPFLYAFSGTSAALSLNFKR